MPPQKLKIKTDQQNVVEFPTFKQYDMRQALFNRNQDEIELPQDHSNKNFKKLLLNETYTYDMLVQFAGNSMTRQQFDQIRLNAVAEAKLD